MRRVTRSRSFNLPAVGIVLSLVAGFAAAASLPAGFEETIVFSGLTNPTAVRFASDGRVFVAEKSGLIKVFDSLTDTTPTVFADLRTEVHNFWDRGLLGLALDPAFPKNPYVYVLYTYDAPIGGTAPTWGTVGGTSDGCPNPPGATGDGCVVSGRLSRLQAAGNVMTGSEQVLIEDWCQQYPSHSIGNLAFGADGKLYVSGGEGANFFSVDYGQFGSFSGPTEKNPCGDPPAGVGGFQTPPTAEGGALRSQDLRTAADPVGLNGSLLRVDPATGVGLPDNPLGASTDPNARRIVGYGFRNPFRFAIKPGTNELWVGDVGWNDWEEIDRISNPTSATLGNFGWPCYEGVGRQPSYDATNLDICENLYSEAGAVTTPLFTYAHSQSVVGGDGCTTGGSSISGLAFYGGGNYPAAYQGALFFADYTRRCMWVMFPGVGGGDPDPANRSAFASSAAFPVDLEIGPGGDLFYVDLDGGTVRRIQYRALTAIATAAPLTGPLPLTVEFDGSSSHGANPGDVLTYAWDLNGDGLFDDSNVIQPSHTYTVSGNYVVRLRVSDQLGHTADSAPITIRPGNTAPTATINTPTAGTAWTVGAPIAFSGSATDPQDGPLPASSLTWTWLLHHCPSTCHIHPLQTFTGVAAGSFPAPDHDYPSYLELQLTATDSGGLSDTKSVSLYPETVALTFESVPTGLQLTFGSDAPSTPFSRTVIVGSANPVGAPSPQTLGQDSYSFAGWSDGGAQNHTITAGGNASTYLVRYSSAASFYTMAPCRLVDTRNPNGPLGGPSLAPGATRSFALTGACGLPASAASVSLNVTIAGPTSSGYVTVFPGGEGIPSSSSLNYRAGQVRANNAIVPLGTGGTLSVYCSPSSSVDVILDVNGYFQ